MKKDPDLRLKKAKEIVADWYNRNKANPLDMEGTCISHEDIYIVWFCKTLGNWKALLSTDIQDTRYYEVTFNGEREEAYLDVYLKESNKVVLLK
jgi:hypothetical protein